jgi:type II secretory pathway pseudopilin PulG
VELLVVITIIGLLVGILVPVISYVMVQMEDARSREWVNNLGSGAVMYQKDYNSYPGQDYTTMLAGTNTNNGYTGSQVLGACLFNYVSLTNTSQTSYDQIAPSPAALPSIGPRTYSSVKISNSPYDSDLFDPADVGACYKSRPNSISDRMSKPMAVLYFVARPGGSNISVSQYLIGDNSDYFSKAAAGDNLNGAYVTSANVDGTYDNNGCPLFWDTKFSSNPSSGIGVVVRNSGAFIIAAAGIDRIYGLKNLDPTKPDVTTATYDDPTFPPSYKP